MYAAFDLSPSIFMVIMVRVSGLVVFVCGGQHLKKEAAVLCSLFPWHPAQTVVAAL